MTIILSCITPDYVVQVSDRRLSIERLTPMDGGGLVREYIPVDDDANKAIWWNGVIGIAYTGLGRVAGSPTDQWATQILSRYPTFQQGIEGLRREATIHFQRYVPYHPYQGLLAFVGVGWFHPPSNEPTFPILFLVSNFHEEINKPSLFRQSVFTVSLATIREGKNVLLYVTGQPLFKHEYYNLTRYIRTAKRKNASPQCIVELLAKTIREVADRNPTVGKNLMVISLPRLKPSVITLPDGQEGILLLSGVPAREHASFYYLSDKNETVQFGPNSVSPGSFTLGYEQKIVDGKTISVRVRPGFDFR